MKVKDCMNSKICYAKQDNKISDVAKMMCDNHVGCLPVCDNNDQVVGIVTDRDIILRCIACDKDVKSEPVKDIMSCNTCCCNAEDDIQTAEEKMGQYQIRRIPVVENGKLVGMLTLGDLAKNEQVDSVDVGCTVENICCNGAKNAE